jgi:hypothetical protein
MKTLTKMLVLACWCLCSVALSDTAADTEKSRLENEALQQQQQIEQEKIDYYNNLNTNTEENNVPINSSEEAKAATPEVPTEADKGHPSIFVSPNNEVEENATEENATNEAQERAEKEASFQAKLDAMVEPTSTNIESNVATQKELDAQTQLCV